MNDPIQHAHSAATHTFEPLLIVRLRARIEHSRALCCAPTCTEVSKQCAWTHYTEQKRSPLSALRRTHIIYQ